MKKIFAVIFVVFFSVVLVFMPAFNMTGVDISKEDTPKKVLTIYHTDVKSGGKNSRGSFLKDVAKEYNKLQNDVFVIVELYEKSEIKNAISSGCPDIISFGSGLFDDETVFREYCGRVNFNDDFLSAVEVDNKIYAVPWSYNGYFLVGSGKTVSVVGNGMLALYLSKKELDVKTCDTVEECYNAFLSSKTPFIATNKELTKLFSRVDRGKIEPFDTQILCGFTDMINVLGIYKNSENNLEAEAFIEYVTSEKVQRKLTRLNLFSPCIKGLYSTSPFSEFEDIPVIALNIFDDRDYCELSKNAYDGDEKAREEIERVLK